MKSGVHRLIGWTGVAVVGALMGFAGFSCNPYGGYIRFYTKADATHGACFSAECLEPAYAGEWGSE